MLSPLPRRNHEGARVVRFPSWRRPSPYPGGIGFRIRCFRGLLGVHCALRPACSLSPYGPFSRNASVASLPPQPFQVLPAGTTLAGRELHPLKGCAFARHTKMPALPGQGTACLIVSPEATRRAQPTPAPARSPGPRAPPWERGRPARKWEVFAGVPPASGPQAHRCSSGVESTTGAVAVGRWRVAVAGGFRPYAGASVHAVAPFPVAARRTGRAALPHPAPSGIMPSPTAGRVPSHSHGPSAVRCTTARRGSGSAPCRPPCVSCATTGAADAGHEHPRCVSHD